MIYSTFFVGNIRDISMSVSVCCICTDFLSGQADCCHPLVCLEWQGKYNPVQTRVFVVSHWKINYALERRDMSKIQNRVNFNLPRWSFQVCVHHSASQASMPTLLCFQIQTWMKTQLLSQLHNNYKNNDLTSHEISSAWNYMFMSVSCILIQLYSEKSHVWHI